MPRADSAEESAQRTKDYSGSPIHRYKNGQMKNVNAPSQVLHVSNLHDRASEEELRKLFGAEQSGTPVVQFFKTNRKMAYVKMDSLQDAILALIRLHNNKIQDRYMKVSFSPKNAGQIVDSDTAEGAEAAE